MCQPGVLSPKKDACAWAKGRRIFTEGQLMSPRKDTQPQHDQFCVTCRPRPLVSSLCQDQ